MDVLRDNGYVRAPSSLPFGCPSMSIDCKPSVIFALGIPQEPFVLSLLLFGMVKIHRAMGKKERIVIMEGEHPDSHVRASSFAIYRDSWAFQDKISVKGSLEKMH